MAVESINTIKSYLAEGKYPTASELVDIIDTLVSIGQNGGGSASDNHLKLISDLDAYTEASVGEIVKYTGQTGKYTRGWDYEKKSVAVLSTEYIDVNDISGRLASIGIPNGRYYKIIDENDTIASKIKGNGLSTAAQYDGGNMGGVMSLDYGDSLIESVGHLGDTGNAFVKISGWHYLGSKTYVDFETGTSSVVLPHGNGLGWCSGWTASEPHTLKYYNPSDVLIFENLQGNRIYAEAYYENNVVTGAQVFALEYNEDEDDYLVITDPEYFQYDIKEIAASATEIVWQPILMPTASN